MANIVLSSSNQLFSLTGMSAALKSLAQQALSGPNLVSMATGILSGDLVGVLERTAEGLFPNLAPELHLAAAVVAGYDHDKTKWLQQALNALNGNTDLSVDGIYGPATVTAVEKFQQNTLGLTVDGFAYRITNAAIQAALTKLTAKAPPTQAPQLAPPQVAAAT